MIRDGFLFFKLIYRLSMFGYMYFLTSSFLWEHITNKVIGSLALLLILIVYASIYYAFLPGRGVVTEEDMYMRNMYEYMKNHDPDFFKELHDLNRRLENTNRKLDKRRKPPPH